MVPVKKPIIAAKAPEAAAAPQKRRPRNTELNSSKKPLTGRISTAGRNPFARKLNCSKLAGSTFDGMTYDEARKILMADELGYEQLWDYFGEYMPKIGAEIGKNVDMQYGETADVFFNTMVECATEEEFIKKVQDQLQKYRDLCIEGDVNSSKDQSVNCAEGEEDDPDWKGWKGDKTYRGQIEEDDDERKEGNGWYREDRTYYAKLDKNAIFEALFYAMKHDPQYEGYFDESEIFIDDPQISETVTVQPYDMSEALKANSPADFDDVEMCVSTYNTPGGSGAYNYVRGRNVIEQITEQLKDPYCDSVDKNGEGSVDSSKNQSVNCAAGESGTVYTDSGNEVAITDIKVVQNPETNALALFVPENGDDEIPEGFTVIGDVIAAASGAPAIEENAETSDDSLNSSTRPMPEKAGDKHYTYHGWDIEESEEGGSYLIESNGNYYDFDSLEEVAEFIDDEERRMYKGDYDEYVSQFDSSKKTSGLNSSKKPPMNRAQRRAARRPKKER